MAKQFFPPLIPGALIAGVAMAVFRSVALLQAVTPFLPAFSALVLIIGLLLGWRFNRSRLILAVLILALSGLGLHLWPADPVISGAVLLLLPMNLALVAEYSERGLFTPLGLVRFGVLGIQPVIVLALRHHWPAETLKALTGPALAWAPLNQLPDSLPQAALLSCVLAFVILCTCYLYRPGLLEAAFLWCLPASVAPLALGMGEVAARIGLAAASLMLVVAMVEITHRLAFRDALTDLPTRRAFREELLKAGRNYTVALVDIDHFKGVNDRHGHDVGDQVLQMVAAKLRKVGGGGIPFRYGGEEFTILFPGRRASGTLPYLERLREEIQMTEFTLRHPSRPAEPPAETPEAVGSRCLAITVSIGVAERSGELVLPTQVLQAADQALYQAKRMGRNRTSRVLHGQV